jgi:hypothetical protein
VKDESVHDQLLRVPQAQKTNDRQLVTSRKGVSRCGQKAYLQYDFDRENNSKNDVEQLQNLKPIAKVGEEGQEGTSQTDESLQGNKPFFAIHRVAADLRRPTWPNLSKC